MSLLSSANGFSTTIFGGSGIGVGARGGSFSSTITGRSFCRFLSSFSLLFFSLSAAALAAAASFSACFLLSASNLLYSAVPNGLKRSELLIVGYVVHCLA
jgi:hypothetical protein